MHELAFLHQKHVACSVTWQCSKMEECCFCNMRNMILKRQVLSNITPKFLTVEEVTGHPIRCKL